MPFQWATETAAACVECFVNLFTGCSSFTLSFLFFFVVRRLWTWTSVNGESAPGWISCPRDFLQRPSHARSYFSHFIFCFLLRGWEACASAVVGLCDGCAAVKQLDSHVQPGIMNLWSLKLVLLTALQALCTSVPVLSRSAEGKESKGCEVSCFCWL